MTEMSMRESFERFELGLQKAADRARQLAFAQKHGSWTQIAFQIEKLLENGRKIYISKALSRQQALAMLDNRVSDLKKNEK